MTFTSNLEEEILAGVEIVGWLNKFGGEFNIPAHYSKYLTNLLSRAELLNTTLSHRIGGGKK
jgi:hypothetical protein